MAEGRAPLRVVAGVIQDPLGRVLISQRPAHGHQGGLWEFPGGKLEPGESPARALVRELREELGIRVRASQRLLRVRHAYGERLIQLDSRRVLDYTGVPRGREGQRLRWAHPETLWAAELPAADGPILSALRLPERMLITGPDPGDAPAFLARLERALAAGIKLVQLRTPGLDAWAYGALAVAALERCRAWGAWLFLNPPAGCPASLAAHGLHLNSRRLGEAQGRPPGYPWVGASCHHPRDLRRAEALGLDYALLSPVCPTASHPQAIPLGWRRFQRWVRRVSLPVYALGGLGPEDVDGARRRGGQGIAAIRGLWPD